MDLQSTSHPSFSNSGSISTQISDTSPPEQRADGGPARTRSQMSNRPGRSRRSLHVAQVIPTINSNYDRHSHDRNEAGTDPSVIVQGQRSSLTSGNNDIDSNEPRDDTNGSSEDSEDRCDITDTALTAFEEGGDHSDDGRFERNYQSFRLNSNLLAGTLQRNFVQVIPNQRRYSSFRLHRSHDQPHVQAQENDKAFTFLLPNQELKIPPKQLSRATKAVNYVVALTSNLKEIEAPGEEEKEKRNCCERLIACCCRKRSKPIQKEEEVIKPSTEITPEMQKASSQGWSMVRKIIFPALPAVLQDLWVYLELVISIVAFILSVIGFAKSEQQKISDSLQTALASLGMILALIDAYFYFIQSGSIARGVKACQKKWKKRRQLQARYNHEPLQKETKEVELLQEDVKEIENDDTEESEEGDGEKKCCRLSKKWKEHFDAWFELVRTILSELLLYPLIIFDMFGFITDATYDVVNESENETDFSLFVVGGFYLILGVYIMRVFIVAGSMISLIRLPKYQDTATNASNAGTSKSNPILIVFCVHVLGQIAVHLLVILVVAAKINNEHRALQILNTFNETGAELSLPDNASPFLILAVLLGWIVPICGVLMFFVVNYYWMKEFSIGFWLNMVSLLQGESFAETVFGGGGLSMTKEKALDFVEKSHYKKVKKQLKRFKATSLWTKFFFPVCVPLTAFCGLLYDIALLSLIACLMLTYIPEEGIVRFVVFTGDNIMTTMFVISVTVIIIANIHLIVLLNTVLLVVILILAIAIAIAFFVSPLILCIYFPSVALIGYCMICIEPSKISKKSARHEEEKAAEEIINSPAFKMNELSN